MHIHNCYGLGWNPLKTEPSPASNAGLVLCVAQCRHRCLDNCFTTIDLPEIAEHLGRNQARKHRFACWSLNRLRFGKQSRNNSCQTCKPKKTRSPADLSGSTRRNWAACGSRAGQPAGALTNPTAVERSPIHCLDGRYKAPRS